MAAQLLFTVGVTCALAFELPSMPLYHITRQLKNELLGYKEGDAEPAEEPATTVAPEPDSHESFDDHDHSRIDLNNKRLSYINYNGKQNYYNPMTKHNYYYSANNKHYHKPLSSNYYFSDKSDNYDNNYIINGNKSGKLSNHKYQSSVFVTPMPFNHTKNVWTNVIKT